MSRKARKFKAFFRPKLGDLQKKKLRVIFRPKFKGFFCPKSGDLQKKKVFAKIQSDFSAEIRNSKVFSAQHQVISKKKKKKKRSLLKVRPVFHPNSLKFPAKSLKA